MPCGVGALPRLADLAKPQFSRIGGGTHSGHMSAGDGETSRWRICTEWQAVRHGRRGRNRPRQDGRRLRAGSGTLRRAAYPGGTSSAVGRHLAGARPLDGSINVGAALSPDGRWIAYLTERLFSVDLVVADAERGQVVATLTDTAANPRYSSLQYIGSGAAWDPRGERLAIATLTPVARRSRSSAGPAAHWSRTSSSTVSTRSSGRRGRPTAQRSHSAP